MKKCIFQQRDGLFCGLSSDEIEGILNFRMDQLGREFFQGFVEAGGNELLTALMWVGVGYLQRPQTSNFASGKERVDVETKGVGKTYSPSNPHRTLDKTVQDSFNGGTFNEIVLTEDTTFYRVYGGDSGNIGSYMTRTPQNGAMQSQIDLALDPKWGNTATNVTTVIVPKGTVIYEGTVAPQGNLLGGGNQVYIPRGDLNPAWFK